MKNYVFAYCIFFVNLVFSQNYVFDADTKSPIEAVSIYLSDGLGVVTNEDGYFELPSDFIIDSLSITHLSYKSKTISFKDIHPKDTIYLNPVPILLDEIVLKQINPRDTILKAIKKIDHNYFNSPYNTYGFYRQSLKENTKGVEMIEVDFVGYNARGTVSTEIVNARRTENYSTLVLRTHGGIVAMFENGDFVRNKAYFLDTDKLHDYEFEFKGQIPYQGLELYKILFHPIIKNVETLRKGVVFIDSKSLAIVEIRYTYDKEKLASIAEASEKNLSTKKPSYSLKDVDNLIRYKQLPDGKWALYYIEAYNLRAGVFKGESYDYHLSAKLVINTIKTEKPVKVKTNYNLSKDFSKVVKKFDNLSRWDDNYKLSLSKNEKQLLDDIQNQSNKR